MWPPFNFFEQLYEKLTDFNDFWYRYVEIWENLTSQAYKFAHLTCQLQPLYFGEIQKN